MALFYNKNFCYLHYVFKLVLSRSPLFNLFDLYEADTNIFVCEMTCIHIIEIFVYKLPHKST